MGQGEEEDARTPDEIYATVLSHTDQMTVAVGNLHAQLRRLAAEVEKLRDRE